MAIASTPIACSAPIETEAKQANPTIDQCIVHANKGSETRLSRVRYTDNSLHKHFPGMAYI
jgi:hypothetical protein